MVISFGSCRSPCISGIQSEGPWLEEPQDQQRVYMLPCLSVMLRSGGVLAVTKTCHEFHELDEKSLAGRLQLFYQAPLWHRSEPKKSSCSSCNSWKVFSRVNGSGFRFYSGV